MRVAVLGGEGLPFLNEFETVSLLESLDSLYSAEAVFVTLSGLNSAPDGIGEAVVEWMKLPARQALAVWIDSATPVSASARSILDGADERFVPVGTPVARPEHIAAVVFDAGFDSSLNNPIGWSPSVPDGFEDVDGHRIWSASGQTVVGATIDAAVHSSTITKLAASGVPVFGGVDSVAKAEAAMQDVDLLWRMSVASRRSSYRRSSSRVRARSFLDVMGIEVPERSPEVGALLLTNKPEFVTEAVDAVLAQSHVSVSLILGLHGDPHAFDPIRDHLEKLGDQAQILAFGADVTLGEALNTAAASCSASVLAKFDDDDWYGPHYLEDALQALEYSGADLVGKARYYVEIDETGDTYLVRGHEEEFTRHVIGSSMVFRRRLWEDAPFPHRPSRVDSIFLRGARTIGATMYSNSRFEFGVRRRADGHTWIVDPAHFSTRGDRVGTSLEDVDVNLDEERYPGFP